MYPFQYFRRPADNHHVVDFPKERRQARARQVLFLVRILHVSDTHIGFSQYGSLTADGLNQREQDVFETFRAAMDLALRERPDVVVHSGDLFDAVRPTNRAVTFAMEQIRRVVAADIPFFVIAGNHDTPRMRETGSVLRYLEFLPGVRAVFRGNVETERYGDVALVGVPQAPSQEGYDRLLAQAAPTEARHNVLVAHAGVVGVGDFRTGEFNELVIPRNRLSSDWDYIALGHYHGCTQVAGNAWYAGSTERFSLREAADEKGVAIVDLAQRSRKFFPLATRPMVRLPPLDATGLSGPELSAAILERISAFDPSGKIATLRVLHVSRSAFAGLQHGPIRRAQQGAVHFALEWDFVPDHSVGGNGSTAIGTLAAEWDAYLESTPLPGDRSRIQSVGRALLAEAERREA